MQVNEQKQLQMILKAQAKLKKMSAKKMKLSVQLTSTRNLIEELEETDQETVHHIIDGILIPRSAEVVKKEMEDRAEFLSSQLNALKEEWDEAFAEFKQMNGIPGGSMPNVNGYKL